MVQALTAERGGINTNTDNSLTALHIGSGSGHTDTVQPLIAAGSDVNAESGGPRSSALRLAADLMRGHTETCVR